MLAHLLSSLFFLLAFLANIGFSTIEDNTLVLIGQVEKGIDSSVYQFPTTVLLLDSTTQNQIASFKTKRNGQFYFALEQETTYQLTVQDTLFKKPYPIKNISTKGITDPTILRCVLPVKLKKALPKNTTFKIIEHPRKDNKILTK